MASTSRGIIPWMLEGGDEGGPGTAGAGRGDSMGGSAASPGVGVATKPGASSNTLVSTRQEAGCSAASHRPITPRRGGASQLRRTTCGPHVGSYRISEG